MNIGNSLYNHVINFEILFENLKVLHLQHKNINDLSLQCFGKEIIVNVSIFN